MAVTDGRKRHILVTGKDAGSAPTVRVMSEAEKEVAQRVRELGPEEVGRQYVAADAQNEDDWWIFEAVWFGRGLDDDTHLAVVLGALNAAGEDEDALWRIGDQPVEEGLLPRSGMSERLIDLRSTTPSLAALWRVMRRYHREVIKDKDSYWERWLANRAGTAGGGRYRLDLQKLDRPGPALSALSRSWLGREPTRA